MPILPFGHRTATRIATAAVFSVLVWMAHIVSPVGAQQPSREAVRVVFAIDNSRSMSEPGGSDTGEERIKGVQRLLEVLDAFQRSASAQRDLQAGAISFGTDVGLLAPLTDVQDPGLASRIRPDDRGATNFVAALCNAWVLVNRKAPPANNGCEDSLSGEVENVVRQTPARAEAERRIVVLLTDGSPAPRNNPLPLTGRTPAGACPANASVTSDDGETYLCALGDLWSVLNRAGQTELIVIGLDAKEDWFPKTEEHWRRVTGCQGSECQQRVVRAVGASDLAELLLRRSGPVDLCVSQTVGEFTCQVPTGLASVGFLVTGVGPTTTTEVCDPTGKCQKGPPRGDWFHEVVGSNHAWRAATPAAGRWRVLAPAGPDRRVFVDFVYPPSPTPTASPSPTIPPTAPPIDPPLPPQPPESVDLQWLFITVGALIAALTPVAVSAWSVRQEQDIPELGSARPIELSMIDPRPAYGHSYDIVRGSVFAARDVPGERPAGTVTMQGLILGPLVVRSWDTSSWTGFVQNTLKGRPLDEVRRQLRKRPPRQE